MMRNGFGRKVTTAMCVAIALCLLALIGVNQSFASYRPPQESSGNMPQNGEPDLVIKGKWQYYDRDNNLVNATRCLVELWTDNTCLDGNYTDEYGNFTLTTGYNNSAAMKVKIYSYYYYWESSPDEIKVLHPDGVYYWDAYNYTSDEFGPYPCGGTKDIGTETIPIMFDWLDAWWIKEDLDQAYTYHPAKGPFIVEWDPDWDEPDFFCACTTDYPIIWNCTLGRIYLSRNAAKYWPDTVLHEMGHAVMWNTYDEYWPMSCWEYLETGCLNHTMNATFGTECAWTEGWANYWAMAVKNSTSVLGWELESKNWTSPGWDDGDEVEGRVAGALWDIHDDVDDGYDEYDGTFFQIWGIVYNYTDDTYAEFFGDWEDRGKFIPEANAAIYQNTIDYNNDPSCTIISPNGGGWYHGIITVSASASDDAGGYVDGTVSEVEFEYSRNHSTWYTIETDTSPSGGWSVSWNTTTIDEDDSVWVRAKAQDNLGAWSSWDESDSSFGINNTDLWADFSADSGIVEAYPNPGVDPPVAYPTSGYVNSTTNTTFNFTDETTGGELPYSYDWDFGDGVGSSTLQNPTYTYPRGGTYDVSLTVTDGLLDEDTETKVDYLMAYKAGDANANCYIDMADVTKVERIILRLDPPNIWADANQNGAINMADVTTIEWMILLGQGGYYC